jgi:hypothetical protein
MPGDCRDGFEYAWQEPVPEPDEGPGLTWRELTPRDWSGTCRRRSAAPSPGTATVGVAYVRLKDPPGLSPITTVGRFDTVEDAQIATGEVWAAR